MCRYVKDLQTGRELSMKEFEDSLGLSPLMREVSMRERSMEASREGEAGSRCTLTPPDP